MSSVDVFTAIAHPTRRQIMVILADRRSMSLSTLSENFDESRQAIRKHIRLLDQCSPIKVERAGREQQCTLHVERLLEVQNSLDFFDAHWDQKLTELQRFLESPAPQPIEGMNMAKKAAGRNAQKASKAAATKKATTKVAKSTAPKTSSVKGKAVAWYIGTLSKPQADIVRALDDLVMKVAPKSVSSIKWAQPVYELKGPFCFIRSAAKHVTIGFWRGQELDDPKGVLEGAGKKMRHLKVRTVEDMDESAFKKLIRQAVRLNKDLGDPTRG